MDTARRLGRPVPPRQSCLLKPTDPVSRNTGTNRSSHFLPSAYLIASDAYESGLGEAPAICDASSDI